MLFSPEPWSSLNLSNSALMECQVLYSLTVWYVMHGGVKSMQANSSESFCWSIFEKYGQSIIGSGG